MKNIELYNDLEKALKIVVASPENVKFIFGIHNLVYDKNIHLCPTCPGSIRAAFDRLKIYFNENKDRLINNPGSDVHDTLSK